MTKGQTIARQLAESVDNPKQQAPSQANPAGCGEADAVSAERDRLWKQWQASSLTLSQVREHYFTRIKTDKHLRSLIRKGKVKLRTFTMFESRLDEPRVTLDDLAELLVSRARLATQDQNGNPHQPSQEPAAYQAA